MSMRSFLTYMREKWGSKPCGHDGLNASLQFDNADLCLLVELSRLDIKELRPAGQAIGLMVIVESIEDFHCGRCMITLERDNEAGTR